MQILVLFGLPGAGKTYIGKIFRENFDFHLYEADQDLPPEMINAVQNQLKITDKMRDKFFYTIIQNTKKLKLKYNKIVVSQTFLKEKHRELFLKNFPGTIFILIQSNSKIRQTRLAQRKEYPLDLKYAAKMVKKFDKPIINYKIINNDDEGEVDIINQLKKFLK